MADRFRLNASGPPRRPSRLAAVALLSAAVHLGCAPAPAPPSASPSASASSQIRVMSFNIRYGTAEDGENAWPRRRDLVMRTIRDFGPTVLGVQEALRFQLDEIGTEFPHFGQIGVGRDDGVEAGEYSAILYDRRRLELLDSGTFWLSDTPEAVASTSWGNRIPRIVTWARFRERVGGGAGDTDADADAGADAGTDAFYVFNTHWDHESQPSREGSAELLLERIARAPPADPAEPSRSTDPVIVTGDFNAGEGNPAFRRLLSADRPRLVDTFRAIHPDAEGVGTFNGFTGERDGEKIDAVLASPDWDVLDAGVVRWNVGGRYPSDHFPVTAVLR